MNTGAILPSTKAVSASYYIGIFVIMCIVVLALLVVSPTQNSFFNLNEKFPQVYADIHGDKHIYQSLINEIIMATSISRMDMMPDNSSNISKTKPKLEPKLEWIDAKTPILQNFIKGNIQILPIYYGGTYYAANATHFPQLMNILHHHNNILNVFFWKMPYESAFLQHTYPLPMGEIDSTAPKSQPINQNILRYTLAINSLTVMEDECSLWVDGKIKQLTFDDYVLWDASKEFSLHNNTNTDGDILFLNIDLGIMPNA